jgi:hypothetical protein
MVPSLLVVPDVSDTAMDAEGAGFTVMVTELVDVQPALVTVTVYAVVDEGDTLIAAVVKPLLQLYVHHRQY